MNTTRVTLIRHGETEWNVAMRLQGIQNSPLTKTGKQQVQLLAKSLSNAKFDVLISSDLGRAIETSEIMNQYHQLLIQRDVALRERNFGVMEGHNKEEIQHNFPGVFEEYMKRKDIYIIPNGESLEQFYERVSTRLNSLVSENEGKHLLVITHGGVLDCAIRMVFSYPLIARRAFKLPNAALNVFLVSEGLQWSLEVWGNISHLNNLENDLSGGLL